ncbi:MAG: nucleotidyl transferase AbiEii/AbiGii toxin family protein [Desulfobacteraceae bacterium]|jgi:hypothetical protein
MQELLKSEYFTEKWLITKSKELSGDPILFEKTVHAFAMLGYLVQLEDNFIFKGGTSLLLYVPKINRLSIDIDIIYGGKETELKDKLKTIPGNTPFIRIEENERGYRGLPNRRHYKFFYNSSLSGKEEYVLLDVVLDAPSYIPFVETKLIKTAVFETEAELSVKVPTIEGLIGDKLTAFAPNTIGVQFVTEKDNSMVMQVVKQLYDIGELFDIASNHQNILDSYNATFEKENSYRDGIFKKADVLQDSIDTCLALLQIQLKGYKNNAVSDYLQDGIKRINSHLLNDKFSIDSKAKITAAKVFCISNLLLKEKTFDFSKDKYSDDKIELLKETILPEPYNRLNRIKPILPEAFYYIWQGLE